MSRIQGGLQAPLVASSEGKAYHSEYQLPEEGIHQALLIGLVVLGTFQEKYGNEEPKDRKKALFIWEFPSVKQLLFEDDTERKSFRKYQQMGFSMHEKSNMLKVVTALCNGQKTPAEIQKMDLFSLIGNRIVLGVSHGIIQKDGEDKSVLNIDSYSRVGKMPLPDVWEPENERFLWFPDANGENFNTDNFGELPNWIREKIMESKEGIAHKQKGGTFAEHKAAEHKEAKDKKPTEASDPKAPKVPNGYEFVDVTESGVGYIEYRNSGWTDKQLFDKQFLRKIEKPKTAQAPPPPSAPVAPPPPPSQPEKETDDFDPFAGEDDDLPY